REPEAIGGLHRVGQMGEVLGVRLARGAVRASGKLELAPRLQGDGGPAPGEGDHRSVRRLAEGRIAALQQRLGEPLDALATFVGNRVAAAGRVDELLVLQAQQVRLTRLLALPDPVHTLVDGGQYRAVGCGQVEGHGARCICLRALRLLGNPPSAAAYGPSRMTPSPLPIPPLRSQASAGDLLMGLRLPFRSLKVILQHRDLLRLSLAMAAVTAVILFALVWSLLTYTDDLVAWLWTPPERAWLL